MNRHKIRYRTDMVIGLDLITLATALTNANTVTLIPDTVYHYFQSDNSAIRSKLSINISDDSIRTKKIIARLLNEKGLHEAATDYLQAWAYIIETHWLRMPSSLTREESSQTFSYFRTLIVENDVIPWTNSTPSHYRYVLSLILSGNDEEALTFLSTNEATNGFSTKEKLLKSIDYVLEQVPNDTGSLIDLAHIKRKDGNLELALEFFEKATKYSASNFGANLQIATLLKELGHYEDAGARLDTALEILTKEYSFYDQIKQVVVAKENLVKAKGASELSSARNELKNASNELKNASDELLSTRSTLINVRDELSLVYASSSWRITKPLRRIMSYFKNGA